MSPHPSRIVIVAAVAALAAASGVGCGGTLYALQANAAASKVEQAKQLGAESLAPYEFTYAREHMTKAMSEAAEGDYSDAIGLAEVAEDYADRAIKLARAAHRGAGR